MRCAAYILAATLAAPAVAQGPRKAAAAEPVEPPALTWEVTLGGAGGFGASTSDMDSALSAAGYASSSSGDFLSATVFPSVRFRIGGHASVGLSFGSTRLGSATGTGSGTAVSIRRSSMDVALVGFWRPVPGVRVGAGPAWYRLKASPEGGSDLDVTKLGWIAEAGLAYPGAGRWYADLAAQYRGTGKADFGTYTPHGKGPLAPAPISLDGIGCEHWAFVAGVGYRF